MLRPLLLAAVAVSLSPLQANAVLVTHVNFDGGSVGQTLSDTTTAGGIGIRSNFDGFTNQSNSQYVGGLSGSLPSSGNAMQVTGSSRFRMILDRTTPAWQASGTLENPSDPNTLIGAEGGTLYGSLLINNSSAAIGFSGLEFAAGDPNANRTITLGEAAPSGGNDFVVLNGGGQVGSGGVELALPPIVPGETREIVFRIDYGASNNDTFTLIDEFGNDAASGTGNFTFSTLHLAAFGGAPAIIYDEIRLGTTLSDVFAPVPEPSLFAVFAVGTVGALARRRNSRS